MSEYHNAQAFASRLEARRAAPAPPSPLGVFYHISCMNDWRGLVTEQLSLLGHVGLRCATACVLGTHHDALWCRDEARRVGVDLSTPYVNDDLSEYEHPTLCRVHRWSLQNPRGAVLYFHTKGVSAVGDRHKRQWRRVMAKHVIADWRRNLELLAVCDLVGANWQESPTLPHYCGNFWTARCDWLAHLDPPEAYRVRYAPDDRRFAGLPWWRMHVECWLGSRPWHHIESLCCRNGGWWGDDIFRWPVHVEGFPYRDED